MDKYTIHCPVFNLNDSWGHTLKVINSFTTFRVLLQNPNGLSLYHPNHNLCHNLQTCCDYGATILALPEKKN
jgi:hypothetical protein